MNHFDSENKLPASNVYSARWGYLGGPQAMLNRSPHGPLLGLHTGRAGVSPFNGSIGQKPYHNFWGDMDGDDQETEWHDVLGDGLLADVMEAQDRANRGLPSEPEDEFLIAAGEPARASARPRQYMRLGSWLSCYWA